SCEVSDNMNGFIVVAIIAIVVLAAVALVGAARRRDTGAAIGSLSSETLKRDRTARKAEKSEPRPGATGREIERAAVLARTGTDVAPVGSTAPVAWTPPDPETYGVTRRQFLNRSVF